MQRRDFIQAGLVAGAVRVTALPALEPSSAPAEPRRHYELRTSELRSHLNPGPLRTFFQDALVPALTRVGAGAIGLFSPDTGFPTQSVITLVEYPSLAAIETTDQRLEADATYTAARRAFETADELPFVRYDARLMRAF